MLHCDMPIIVEGKYDKITLANLIDAPIIPTGGFGIYRNKELLEMLRALAKKTGIVILTDSDAAGFKIRSHIRSAVRDGKIINVYIPDVYGKERRKAAPSREGKLGVEGLSREILEEAFRRAGIGPEEPPPREAVRKGALVLWGLTGADNAAARRAALLKALGFPERMSTNSLLGAVNVLYSREEFFSLLARLFPTSNP